MRPAQALWQLAALLAVGAAVEIALPDQKRAVVDAAPFRVDATAAAPLATPTATLAATLLERPVFSPTRRPSDSGPAPAEAVPARPEPPRLTGIVMTPAGRRAIFASAAADGHGVVVSVGGTVGPWVVQAIGIADVQLTRADERRTVRVAYSDTAAAATTAAPEPVLSAPVLLPPLQPSTSAPFSAITAPTGADIFLNAARSAQKP